jgi:PAS domain S-box-containing protein
MESRLEHRVDVLDRWLRAYHARDVDAILALLHPDIECTPLPEWMPEVGGFYRGHEGIRELMAAQLEQVPDRHVRSGEPEEVGRALLVPLTVTSQGSNIPPQMLTVVHEFDGGLVRRIRTFSTEAEARAAAEDVINDEFLALFEHAIEAITLVDSGGRLQDANESACTLYGLSREQLDGRNVRERVAPDALDSWDLYWGDLLAHGHSSGEGAVITGTGERVPVEFRARGDYRPGVHLVLLSPTGAGAPPALAGEGVLTPREREVFRLLALGFNAPEIAERLFLAPGTVRTHVRNGVVKLGAKTRVQATALALTRGEIAL